MEHLTINQLLEKDINEVILMSGILRAKYIIYLHEFESPKISEESIVIRSLRDETRYKKYKADRIYEYPISIKEALFIFKENIVENIKHFKETKQKKLIEPTFSFIEDKEINHIKEQIKLNLNNNKKIKQ